MGEESMEEGEVVERMQAQGVDGRSADLIVLETDEEEGDGRERGESHQRCRKSQRVQRSAEKKKERAKEMRRRLGRLGRR